MEVSNLSDAEFKTLVIRMLKELSEHFNSIKRIQSEMKEILIEIKNNLQKINNEVDEAENQINDLEYKDEKAIISTARRKKNPKNEDSISRLWDNFKKSNIHIIRVPEGEEKEQEVGNLFEKIMKENFSNLVKEIDIQSQEAKRVPKKLDPNRTTIKYI